jgi:hypothetical protein
MAVPGYNVTLRNNQLDQITSFAGSAALLRIYDGTRPATGGAITTQNLLSEHTCGTPFAAGASGGVLTANAIADDASANFSGTASWARLVKSDGTTHVMDLDVGTVGTSVIINTTTIVAAAPVQVTSFVVTRGNP